MGCARCRQKATRIDGLSVFKQRLQQRSSNRETVNRSPVTSNTYEANVARPDKVSRPRITPYGWVATCLICNKDGSPAQLPQLATVQCSCEDI